jgi:phosphatidyl-myo-inositol dimannoside synthase
LSTVLVATDHHFTIDAKNRTAVQPLIPATYYDRYQRVFDHVIVMGRARRVEDIDPSHALLPADLTFVALPDAHGPRQLLTAHRTMGHIVRATCQPEFTYILRAPGRVSPIVAAELRRRGLRFAVEVAGDPALSLAKGANNTVMRPLYQWLAVKQMRRQLREAIGVSYVTSASLQRQYPPPPGAVTASYSSIDLLPEAFVAAPRSVEQSLAAAHLITVCSLVQPYKGVDVLIEAVRRCLNAGVNLRLTVVGDGPLRGGLERQAAEAGLADSVEFVGEVPAGPPVRRLLGAADLFVLASRDEGLPRSLIEAMARGLPAIATAVGGIPELLPPSSLVPPDDPQALADRIREYVLSPERLSSEAAVGFETAQAYRSDLLSARRDRFYRAVRDSTETRRATG